MITYSVFTHKKVPKTVPNLYICENSYFYIERYKSNPSDYN